MNKRLAAIFAALVLPFSFAACGAQQEYDDDDREYSDCGDDREYEDD